MKAVPGTKHQLYFDHVKTNICNGNEQIFQYLLHWMARAVQQPDKPGEVAIVLRGDKATGKTIFADVFGRLFGPHYWAVSDIKYVSHFNVRLRDCVVMVYDETSATDRNRVKALITDKTIVIEEKGRDAETVNNRVHLIITSNNKNVPVPTTHERRFLVLDVAKTRQGDAAYFNTIMKDLESGGLANLLYALQTLDLGHFDHFAIP